MHPLVWIIFCLIAGRCRYKSLSTNPAMASESCQNGLYTFLLHLNHKRKTVTAHLVKWSSYVAWYGAQCNVFQYVSFYCDQHISEYVADSCSIGEAMSPSQVACMCHVKHDGTCQVVTDPCIHLRTNHRTSTHDIVSDSYGDMVRLTTIFEQIKHHILSFGCKICSLLHWCCASSCFLFLNMTRGSNRTFGRTPRSHCWAKGGPGS